MAKISDKTITATSTLCTAVFPSLDLRLPAGVPTPIPASAAALIQTTLGVVVSEDPCLTPSPKEI
jgi:hypothetical protein